MFATTASVLGALAGLIAVSNAAPAASATSAAAIPTATFTPYKYVGCRQDQNPHNPQTPSHYNITVATGCVTTPYTFDSYVDFPNDAAKAKNCSLLLFTQTGCKGAAKVADTVYGCGGSSTGDISGGASARLFCPTS